MPRRISDEKRETIKALLLSGESPKAVAKAHKVSERTVRRILKEIPDQVEEMKEGRRYDLETMLLDYVAENFATQTALLKQIRQPDWIKKQSGRDIAVMLGVLSDKTVRILSAVIDPGEGAGGEKEAGA